MTQDPGGSDLLRRFAERRVRIQSALTLTRELVSVISPHGLWGMLEANTMVCLQRSTSAKS
uniref:Uncharacterized protein n=1 Tax=Ralstonia solanacearum TaxID=305 RepID=A0A809E293_RALSL